MSTDLIMSDVDIELPVLEATAPKPPSLWRKPDFRRLWVGETVSVLGNAISGIAVPLVALNVLHAQPYVIGLLAAVSWLPWLIIGLPAGAWIDRLPRRPTMIVANVVSFVLVVSVPIAYWLGALTIAQLVIVEILGGITGVFFGPAFGAWLPTVFSAEELPLANAKMEGSAQAAVVSGGSLGGLLAQAVGAVAGLGLDAVSYVVSTICLIRVSVKEPPRSREPRSTTVRQEIAAGFRFLIRDPYMRIMTIGAAIDNLLLSGGQALLVVFLIRTIGVGPGWVGVLMAGDCFGGMLGAFAANRLSKRFGSGRAMLWLSLASTPFGLLIPLAGPGLRLIFFAAGLLIPAAGIVAVNIIGGSWRQVYCPPDMLGRIGTSGSFLSFSLIPLGALMGGALGTQIGVRPTLWILLATGAVGKAILLIGPLRHTRDLPRTPAHAA